MVNSSWLLNMIASNVLSSTHPTLTKSEKKMFIFAFAASIYSLHSYDTIQPTWYIEMPQHEQTLIKRQTSFLQHHHHLTYITFTFTCYNRWLFMVGFLHSFNSIPSFVRFHVKESNQFMIAFIHSVNSEWRMYKVNNFI